MLALAQPPQAACIAAAQGKTIAGGLMLLWVADIIIASDDAQFVEPTVGMGVNGVEYFAHPWELGPRKAKELLFTERLADGRGRQGRRAWSTTSCPRDELHDFTMAMAAPDRDEAVVRACGWPRRA